MYTLFNEPLGRNVRKVGMPRFDYTLRLHRENLKRSIGHYRGSSYSVPSNHLLVNLIQTMPSMLDMDLRTYADRITDFVDEFAQAFKLTTAVSPGKSHTPGPFLGKGSEEIIVLTAEEFSIPWLKNNWHEASPIRWLRHPRSDLNAMPPYGAAVSKEIGVSVVLINVPLLACQYRIWRERELKINPEFPRTTMQFVATFVLPNSLYSFQDVAYFNVLRKLFEGEVLTPVPDKHPFYLDPRFDATADGVTELLHSHLNKRYSFREFLEAVPAITADTLREVVAIPRMAYTRQLIWALVVARLPLITMFILWNERAAGSANRDELNTLRRSLRQLRSDRNLDALTSRQLTDEIDRMIAEDIQPFL